MSSHDLCVNGRSRLLPPRMALVGLGVDPVAERMARFISGGPVDISVVTFHGFGRDGERLLARQLKVEQRRPPPVAPYVPVAEMRRALRKYLVENRYQDLFDQVYADLRRPLPKQGLWEQPGSKGIGFMLPEPDKAGVSKTYFGLYAGYRGPDVYSVSILPQAIHWGEKAFERLGESVDLRDWPHGGYAFSFKSREEWDKLRRVVLEFVDAVMTNRSDTEASGT